MWLEGGALNDGKRRVNRSKVEIYLSKVERCGGQNSPGKELCKIPEQPARIGVGKEEMLDVLKEWPPQSTGGGGGGGGS